MPDWKRSTREVSFEQLPTDVKTAIHQHIDLYQLGDILAGAILCIQTDSEKPKKGLFGSAEAVRQCAVLTSRWLLWVVSGTKTTATATSALLKDVVVQDYEDTPFVKMIPDSGIQITGKFTDVAENGSAFLGLEENTAGRKFKEAVIRAVQDVKK